MTRNEMVELALLVQTKERSYDDLLNSIESGLFTNIIFLPESIKKYLGDII